MKVMKSKSPTKKFASSAANTLINETRHAMNQMRQTSSQNTAMQEMKDLNRYQQLVNTVNANSFLSPANRATGKTSSSPLRYKWMR